MTNIPLIDCVWEIDNAEFRFVKLNLVVRSMRKKSRMKKNIIDYTDNSILYLRISKCHPLCFVRPIFRLEVVNIY